MNDLNALVASADFLLVKMADKIDILKDLRGGPAPYEGSPSDAPDLSGFGLAPDISDQSGYPLGGDEAAVDPSILQAILNAVGGAAGSVADTAKDVYGGAADLGSKGIHAIEGAAGSVADTAKDVYGGAADLGGKGIDELNAQLAALQGKLSVLGEKASPYVPTALLGAGGAGLISELLSKEKDKGIMDYLPWLLLGGAGGYGMYNQFKGK